jgi:hypothetical protein
VRLTPGPEIRITATPDGSAPLDKAKIVSWNIICSIALYDLRTDKP